MKIPKSAIFIAIAFLFCAALPGGAIAQTANTVRPIVFPVIGHVSFGNDYGDPRSGGRTHQGNDLMGKKMLPLVAVVDGTIDFVVYPQASWGYSISIQDKDGYEYRYLHMNNDNPGTDDGKGDGVHAYALDVQVDNVVKAGQLIGYVGDSGNAEGTPPHLHFEIRKDGQPINPYDSLKAATRISAPIATYPELPREILPYETFAGGMSVASGNVDADSDFEVITGALAGGGPLVRVFKKDKTPVSSFYAYSATFRGGVDVATGDVDGDGISEIITAAGPGGGPHIRVFKSDGKLVNEFFAYSTTFRGGVQIASGDVDGDGKAEILTGPGAGGGPHIRLFSPQGQTIREFFAYASNFHGGVDVAIVKKGANQNGSIVTSPLSKGGPHIKIFDASTGATTKEFFAYDGGFMGGVRVSVGDIDSSAQGDEIIAIPASAGGPHVSVFRLDGVSVTNSFAAFEEWYRGGYDLAFGNDVIYIGSGPGRRASLRAFTFTRGNPWLQESSRNNFDYNSGD